MVPSLNVDADVVEQYKSFITMRVITLRCCIKALSGCSRQIPFQP